MTRKFSFLLSVFAVAGCTTLDQPTQSNLAQYCTAENAFRLGSQSRAYLGVCPKESEAQFLQGLARGRALRPSTPAVEPYYEQIRQTEQRLLATSSEAEREPLRARLRDLEWWAIHLLNTKGNYLE
jgi:hypothetical protein